MRKAFCLVAFPLKGAPLSKAAAVLGPLVQAAKATRVSGKFEGKPVSEVFVLASTAVAPVVHYRCARVPARVSQSPVNPPAPPPDGSTETNPPPPVNSPVPPPDGSTDEGDPDPGVEGRKKKK